MFCISPRIVRSAVRAACVSLTVALSACNESPTSASGPLQDFVVNVSVTGAKSDTIDRVQVCVDFVSGKEACGPERNGTGPGGFFIGSGGTIALRAVSGESYTAVLPVQQAVPYCRLLSGISGMFAGTMQTIVVRCGP
jgi:hypothetical protein